MGTTIVAEPQRTDEPDGASSSLGGCPPLVSVPAAGASPIDHSFAPALQQACAQVRKLLESNDARDALARYQIGCIIRDVRNQVATYGEGSVGKIARAVGRDVDTLYEYADVAETWSETEIGRLLARRTPLGVPLSFSHLVELSRLRRDREALKALTDRALAGISVRHLRALIDEKRQRSRAHGAETLQRLGALVRHSEGLVSSTKAIDELVADLHTAGATPKLEQLLVRALNAHRELLERSGLCVAELQAELERVRAELQPS